MKYLHYLTASLLLLAGAVKAQIVTNGTFDSSTGWTEFNIGGPLTYTYNYTTDRPSGTATGGASTGGVLRLESGGDGVIGGLYTQVTLTGGRIYELDGLAKAALHSPTSNWLECFLTQTQPVNGVATATTRVTQLNSWVCPNFDSVFLSCETLSNSANGQGRFTVPGSGSQSWFLVVQMGVCCGGGPADILVDTVTLTDVGSAVTFDTPPTPLDEDFNDGDDVNNYGGEYRAFAGGDPGGSFASQDASMTAASEDAQGTTGAPGDRGLHIFANTPLQGVNFIYYGGVLSLSPAENVPQDLTSFTNLEFDIKLGTGGATTDWIIRLEDTSATPPENFRWIDLTGELTAAGTTYRHVSIPLNDFVSAADGGSVSPNLSTVKVITLAVKNTALLATSPNIYLDNIEFVGAAPTYDTPPTPVDEDFDDGDDRNNYGGLYTAFAGGDPGGSFQVQDSSMQATSEDAQGLTGTAGDRGLRIQAVTPLQGQSFIYYGAVLSLSPSGSVGQDLSGFDTLEFDIKLGTLGATKDWAVRIEDTSATAPGDYKYMDIEADILNSGYAHISIALDDLVNSADGGTVAPNLAQAKSVVITVQNVALLATAPDIVIDNLMIQSTSTGVNDWELYE